MKAFVSDISNGLLSLIDEDDMSFLRPTIRLNSHDAGFAFETAGRMISDVHFLTHGIAALIARNSTGAAAVGVISHDGMTGSTIAYGIANSDHDCVAILPCHAYSVPVAAFSAALEKSASLRSLVLRYAHTLALQSADTAVATARCSVEARVARVLLILDDRCPSPWPITHDQLALMLGARRPGITVALQTLEMLGLIKAERKKISILKRDGLLGRANGTYSSTAS